MFQILESTSLSSHWFQILPLNVLAPLEVCVVSVGLGVQWDMVTEYHLVPVHRVMCKYTIIPSSLCPTELRGPLNPCIPLRRGLVG